MGFSLIGTSLKFADSNKRHSLGILTVSLVRLSKAGNVTRSVSTKVAIVSLRLQAKSHESFVRVLQL